jgi:hypothetical protein
MSYDSSMVYTMGTALSRALEDHTHVEVLVEGVWLAGSVVLHDGVGVVLDSGEEHSVVKVDRIGAIRVRGQLPWEEQLGEGPSSYGDATPMPGPRPPHNS